MDQSPVQEPDRSGDKGLLPLTLYVYVLELKERNKLII